jgi:hypothetical protein
MRDEPCLVSVALWVADQAAPRRSSRLRTSLGVRVDFANGQGPAGTLSVTRDDVR